MTDLQIEHAIRMDLEKALSEARAENSRLRAVMEPFAKVAADIPENWPGDKMMKVFCKESYGSYYIAATVPTIAEWRALGTF